MNANDVLIDLLEDNRRRWQRLLSGMTTERFFWSPEPGANSTALTLWHMGRIFDVFLTQQAQGCPSEEQCWFRGGWVARAGYDPRGKGLNGWGMLTGFTPEDVAAMPHLTRELILGYLNEVYDTVKAYLASTPEEALHTPAAGFEGKHSRYQCVQMPLLDNVRHLGEIYALQASYDRRFPK